MIEPEKTYDISTAARRMSDDVRDPERLFLLDLLDCDPDSLDPIFSIREPHGLGPHPHFWSRASRGR